MPLSNNLASSPNDIVERYPLKVLLCRGCGLSQLSIVIPPEEMFSHYVYRSGISNGYVDHCREMAKYLKNKYGLNQGSFMIDIAGNDCALLTEFQQEIGLKVLNVDPAKNLVPICEDKGVRMFNTFWGMSAARHLENTSWPKADLITATNVFAHVDDVKEFIGAVAVVLKHSGILVLEFPYLIDFIDKKEFDTIYFEHLSYFSIYPLDMVCRDAGLEILHVSKHDIHGGSVRVEIGHKTEYLSSDFTVSQAIKNERSAYSGLEKYEVFAKEVQTAISNFRAFMVNTVGMIAGFAASAKGNTLLNCAGITSNEMNYIVDQTPEKIGMYSPGTRIPILDMKALRDDPPDYLVILSWNFKDEIIGKVRAAGYKGKFVIPIPELEIID